MLIQRWKEFVKKKIFPSWKKVNIYKVKLKRNVCKIWQQVKKNVQNYSVGEIQSGRNSYFRMKQYLVILVANVWSLDQEEHGLTTVQSWVAFLEVRLLDLHWSDYWQSRYLVSSTSNVQPEGLWRPYLIVGPEDRNVQCVSRGQ